MVPDAARELERLLLRRHALNNILLNVDMFDRWGPKSGPEYEQMMADGAQAQGEQQEVTRRLAALSVETWQRDPDAIRAWATAHIDLLERFIAGHAGDTQHDTAVFVAREEIAAWREVAAGARPYVEENVFYVRVDPLRHAEWFGELRGGPG
jgi:hypothetical protein